MSSRRFTKTHLKDLGLPYGAINDKVIDNTRWSIIHEITFPFDGKFYQTTYSVGATEQQDESPWEYEDEIICEEVQLIKKEIFVWEKVN